MEKTCENCKHAGDNGIFCDSCTYSSSYWELKESEGKEMRLDLPVMLLSIKNNRNKTFRRISDGLIIEADEDGNLIWESGYRKLNVNDEFILAKQPVTFMEAVNSRKRIRPDDEDFPDYDYINDWVKHVFLTMTNNTFLELINGTWFVEDAE